MKRLSLGTPGQSPEAKLDWIVTSLRKIEDASRGNDPVIIAQNYTLTGTNTATRNLNLTAPTLANVVAVLATIIQDLQKGGANRTT